MAVAGPVGFFDMMVVWLGWPDSCGRQAAIAPASLNFQFPGFAEALGLALILTIVSVEMLGGGSF